METPISIKGSGTVLVFADATKVVDYAIEDWERMSAEAVRRRGYFSVALSGGKTPVPLYRRLAAKSGVGCWDKTHVFLADERFVPVTDPESNYRMIRETLLDAVRVAPSNVHPVPTDLPDPGSAARKYGETLTAFFRLARGEFPVFDLILLGLGADGHTASLFPGTAALREKERIAVAVSPGGGKRDRITLTFPVINRARKIVFLVTGKEKAEALRGVVEFGDALLPASGVRPVTGELLFLTDTAAAAALSGGKGRRV
jgi:6-phosphogluconolactonase